LACFYDTTLQLSIYTKFFRSFAIGLLRAVGFKTRLASIAGNIMFVVMMFGTVAQKELRHGAYRVVVRLDLRGAGGFKLCEPLFPGSHEEIVGQPTDFER
jgi:hypothetical protein